MLTTTYVIIASLAHFVGSTIAVSLPSHQDAGLQPFIVPPAVSYRIVGGSATTIEQYPWTVSLQWMGAHRCGAALISPTRCLTAAHCTDRTVASALSVRYGSTSSVRGGQLIQVTELHQHPNFVARSFRNDLCVLELYESLATSSIGVVYAPIPNAKEPVAVGLPATVVGWGDEKEGRNQDATHLRAVRVPIVDAKQCKKWYPNAIDDGMLCAGFASGGRDACQNDSGGPLTVNGLLVGIVSWGVGCARPNRPGVYTNVAYYRDWIDQYVEVKPALLDDRRVFPKWWFLH